MSPGSDARKPGMGGMILAILGGILAMAGPFFLFYASASNTQLFSFGRMGTTWSILDSPWGEFSYIWLIVIGGILALVLAPLAYSIQNRAMAAIVFVFGLVALLIPIIFAVHLSLNFDASVANVFWHSPPIEGGSYVRVYLGGIFAMIGGLLALIGGLSLVANIGATAHRGILWDKVPSRAKDDGATRFKRDEFKIHQTKLDEMKEEQEEKKKEEEELALTIACDVELDVPTAILVGETGIITVKIINQSYEVVDKITLDLADLEHYFQVTGSTTFTDIEPEEEKTGSIKITPKQGEGIYPIIIEAKEGENSIEKKYSIKVEGKDSY